MMSLDSVLNDHIQNSKNDLSDSYKYQNVIIFKDIFDRKLFPNDFDIWTLHEQYTWINKNLAIFFPNVSQNLLNYIPANFRPLDYDRSLTEIPEWLDMEKYRRAQKFVQKNIFSIIFSILMNTIYIYSFNDGLKGLIITKQSSSLYLGFKRYFFLYYPTIFKP